MTFASDTEKPLHGHLSYSPCLGLKLINTFTLTNKSVYIEG